MKILILSANTGGGHNAAAHAIAARLQAHGATCEIIDTLAFISPQFSSLISHGHDYLYRHHPHLFGIGYCYEEHHTPRLICRQCARGADALGEKLRLGGFDAVICVHVFAGLMLSALRRRHVETPPAYFVATDYTCSPGVSEMCLDGYFIPHPLLMREFIRHGLPTDKLIPSGIPIAADFYTPLRRDVARDALNLPSQVPLILLGCGSIGCGKLERHALAIAETLSGDAQLLVLCGRNRTLYEHLIAHRHPRVTPIALTDRMPLYLASVDLYITKAGGLSTTEAIAMKRPMVCINAIDGLERRNFDFLIARGVACGAKTWSALPTIIEQQLAASPRLQALRRARTKAFCPHNAADLIARTVLAKGSI